MGAKPNILVASNEDAFHCQAYFTSLELTDCRCSVVGAFLKFNFRNYFRYMRKRFSHYSLSTKGQTIVLHYVPLTGHTCRDIIPKVSSLIYQIIEQPTSKHNLKWYLLRRFYQSTTLDSAGNYAGNFITRLTNRS